MTVRTIIGLLLALGGHLAPGQEKVSPWKGDIERYRSNYVVGGFSFDAQIKFQLSIRYRIFTNYPLYFAYSQRSFWNLYDWANSTPFRESNYMPELFYRISGGSGMYLEYLQAGVEHESNGLSGTASRSWNKLIFASRVKVIGDLVYVEPRFWIPFAIAAENEDIRTYIGFGQLTAVLFLFPDPENNRLELMVRPGFKKEFTSVSFLVNLMLRPLTSLGLDMFGANPFLLLQVWHGYGESLLEYNVRSTRFRIGFTF